MTPSSAPSSDSVSAGPRQEQHLSSAPTILLVEDNEHLATTMRMMLEALGYGVRQANTARAAADVIDSGTSVDLVFSDIVMPGGMNGLELARDLRERKPALPVILATGYAHAARDARAEGFQLMVKPYPMDDLQRLLLLALGDHAPEPGQA